MAGDNDCDKELLQWWQWWWASVHIVPCKFLMQGRKRDDEACFLGNTYAGSRDTLALGWGTTQTVFIPGVGSIRWLSISSWSPISCSFVMSFRNLTFLNQIIGTPTYIRSHPALELRRRCWKSSWFQWPMQNALLPWDGGRRGQQTIIWNVCKDESKYLDENRQRQIQRQGGGGRITENMLCAGNEEQQADTCQVGMWKMPKN